MKISIIIPTYNRSATIKYCIDSILNQSYQNFEIIVVDDCSSDNTVEIVREIKDSRINCIVLEQNAGAQNARNVGIINAKYDWIAFQDSDDEWMPDKLNRQINALALCNYDINTVVHGNCYVYNHAKNSQHLWSLPLTEGNCYLRLLSSPSPVFPALLTSKLALERIGYLDCNVPSYQEWDTSIRLSQYCNFIHLKEPLFIYHQHIGETISKNKFTDLVGYQFIIQKFKSEILSKTSDTTWNNHLGIQLNKIIYWNLYSEVFNPASQYSELFYELKEYLYETIKKEYGYKEKYESIKNSNSFKIGQSLLKPFRKIKHAKKNIT